MSSSENFFRCETALALAFCHACAKSGSTPPNPGALSTAGGLDGSASVKTPEMVMSEGTGNGVKETGVIVGAIMPIEGAESVLLSDEVDRDEEGP